VQTASKQAQQQDRRHILIKPNSREREKEKYKSEIKTSPTDIKLETDGKSLATQAVYVMTKA